MNYDLDSINPDTLGKDELVEWLTKLTSGSPEQWRQEPVRSLRAELAAAIQAARDARRTVSEATAQPVVVQTTGIDASTLRELSSSIEDSVTRKVLSRLSVTASADDEAPVEVSAAALKQLTHESREFRVPDIDETYINPVPGYSKRLELKSRSTAKPRNVALWGPTGAGKTTYAIQFAAQHDRPLYILNFGEVTEAEQLLGHWEARDGSTIWVDSDLVHAIQTPFAVILLDELNRGATAKVTNAAFEMLDDRRSLGGFAVAPGVIFFATLNEGVEYTGTDELDAAINDRFSEGVFISYSPKEKDILIARYGADPATAERAVALANNLRGVYPLSLRVLGAAIEEIKFGASLTEALLFTIGRRVPVQTLVGACAATWPEVDFSGYLL